MGVDNPPSDGCLLVICNDGRGYEMKITNHEIRNLFASFLTGMVLAVVLGSMVALSTSAFALGGGGQASAPAPAPKISKVVDPVAEPENEIAEVKKPVVEPGNEVPDEETPVGELKAKGPEEKTFVIEDPDEDKTETKPDERATEFPKPEVVEATVGFAASTSLVVEGNGLSEIQIRISRPLPQPVVLSISVAGTAAENVDYKISSASLAIPAGTTSSTITLIGLDDDVDEANETITLTLAGTLPEGVAFDATTHTVVVIDDDVAELEEIPEVIVSPGDETGTETEDKTVDRHDEKIIDFPESGGEVVETTVGFGKPSRYAVINHPRSISFTSFWRGRELGWSKDNNSMPVPIVLSNPLPQPLELSLNAGEADARLQDGEGTIDVYYPSHLTFAPGETRKVLWFDLDIVDGSWDSPIEPVRFTLYGDLPDGVEFGTRSLALHFELVFHAPDDEQDGIDEAAAVEDIDVSHYDEGRISIVNEEHVHEIRALHYDADNKDTEISIENLGVVDNSVVARIFNFQNSGGISIKNAIQGTVGSDVIGKHHGDGKVSIENHGTIGHDIRAVQFGDGGIEITNYGNVGSSIEATKHGSGAVSIENHGNVWSEIRILHRGSGDISIDNHEATAVTVDHYGAGDILIKNYGVDQGTSVRHHGDNGIIRFDGNLLDAGFAAKTIRFGNVNFINIYEENYRGEEVIVDFAVALRGGYEASSDTQLNFHISPDINYGNVQPGSIRKLRINGDVTGQSRVSLIVDDVSFITESTNFPRLILVEGDHDVKTDSFVGEQTIGAFNYVLEHDTFEEFFFNQEEWYEYHVWGFINQGLSDTAKKVAETPDEIAENIETPPTKNPDKKTELGLWGEQNGSHTAIGLNALATRLMGGDMVVGTSMARNLSASNNVNVESQITALTANWERKGLYVGGQTRYARFTSDVSTDRLSVVRDNEGTGVNASVDLGYRLALPFDGVDFQVAPQAQLVWSRVNFDDFVGPHGELVSLEDGDLVTGHLGLSWDGEWQDDGGFGRIYGGMNLRGALDGKTSVNVSGISIANERRGLSVDGKLGLSYDWDEGYAVYGEVSALRDGDANEIRADLGVRIDF